MTDNTNSPNGVPKQPVFEALQALIDAGHELIPINGKVPAAMGWRTAKPLELDKAVDRLELTKGNVGVRLRPTDLVIDVDPRNFDDGDDPVRRLEKDLGIRFLDWMSTVTGSGGTHHYMRVESGQSFMNELAAYAGIEFKAHGRQVVAPGSIHPETGLPYVFRRPDPLDECIDAPMTLLALIRRPVGASTAEPGVITPDDLADLLRLLDPIEFGSNDLWFPVMAASHHATGGDGLEEFLAWSAGDAGYADQETKIAARWNSLHADSSGRRFTAGTLANELRRRGHEAEAARLSARLDFPEDVVELHENLPEQADAVKAKRQASAAKARQVKAEKGALRKLRQAADAESYARFMNGTFVFSQLDGKWFNIETGEKFAASNMEIVHGPGWARSGGRGSLVQAICRGKSGIEIPDVYMAAAFPGKPRIVTAELGSGHPADMLNTWYDTTLPPIEGDHEWFLEEVRRWFPGDTYQQEILLDELALRVLEPGRKIRHALVIESVQGVGKGQLKGGFETLFGWGNCGVFGVTQMKDKFDRWKVGAANLFGEEIGFNKWSDAKEAYEAMKTAITDDYIAIRPMNGESELKVPNGTNYVINRNPDMKFYIPAGGDDDERRICYLRPEPDPIDEKGPVFQRLKRHYSSKADMQAVAWWLINTWSSGRRVYEEQGIELAGVGHASYDSDPPMTEAKRSIIREGMDADHIAPVNFVGLARVVDELGSLFTTADAVALVKTKRLDQFDASDGKLVDAVSKWLKAEGFKRTRNTSGQGVTIYSPATNEWSAKKAAEREKAYLSGKTGA